MKISGMLHLYLIFLGLRPGYGFLHPIRQRHHPNPNIPALYSTKIDSPNALEETSSKGSPEIQQALQSLASTTLALLAGNEDAASILAGGASEKRHVVTQVFKAYDVCESGTLSVEEAKSLFADLARSMVLELSKGTAASPDEEGDNAGKKEEVKAAQAHARRVLADDEAGNTIDRVAGKLLLMADMDGDEMINLQELAQLFETIFEANLGSPVADSEQITMDGQNGESQNSTIEKRRRVPSGKFPQPLRALAGSLQLLPPRERSIASEAADKSVLWNVGVAGDDHTLRRVILEDGESSAEESGGKKKKKKKQKQSNSLSLIGLGRSADASAYFIPELGIALDAGLHVSSLRSKTVLLTHGHRDHIGALPGEIFCNSRQLFINTSCCHLWFESATQNAGLVSRVIII